MFAYSCWCESNSGSVARRKSYIFPCSEPPIGVGVVDNEVKYTTDCRRDWITLDTKELNKIKLGVIPEGKWPVKRASAVGLL